MSLKTLWRCFSQIAEALDKHPLEGIERRLSSVEQKVSRLAKLHDLRGKLPSQHPNFFSDGNKLDLPEPSPD